MLARPELARMAPPAIVPASGNGMPTRMPASSPLSPATGFESQPWRVCRRYVPMPPTTKPTSDVNGIKTPNDAASSENKSQSSPMISRPVAGSMKRFGSGWAWLVTNKAGALEISSTPNQDSPLMAGLRPVFGVDVWEHAYYLKYQNKRPDYVDAFWNVVDWNKAEANFQATK